MMTTEEEEQWEEDLAKELEDLGLEGEENVVGTIDGGDEQWENEIKLLLESHSTDT